MAPGGKMFRYSLHFGENVLPYGSHEWLPYSKDEVRLITVNTNLCVRTAKVSSFFKDHYMKGNPEYESDIPD